MLLFQRLWVRIRQPVKSLILEQVVAAIKFVSEYTTSHKNLALPVRRLDYTRI